MMKDMASSSLEDLCLHINIKISNIKKCLLLRDIGKDDSRKPVLHKIQNQVILVHDLLNKMENEIKQQEKLKDSLKEMQKAAERDQKEAQHLLEHIPRYLPKPQNWYVAPEPRGFGLLLALSSCSTVQLCSFHSTSTGELWEPKLLCLLILELALVQACASTPTNLSGQVYKTPGCSSGSFQG
ncbi:SKA complex subunit 1 [Geothlypis trichas]